MAKRKRPGRPPQAQHAAKSNPSRHDNRKRLSRPSPNRQLTEAASVPLISGIAGLTASPRPFRKPRSSSDLIVIAL